MLEAGDPAPQVTLALADGTSRSLADYTGAPLVLYFYPKDDTSGCTAEAQAFTVLSGDFAEAGASIVGVSKDNAAKHLKFAEKYDLKVALASDMDGSVCEAFGTWIEKSMYGRKYMGIDRATFLIDGTGTIAQVWRKVKVPVHADAVLTAVRSLAR